MDKDKTQAHKGVLPHLVEGVGWGGVLTHLQYADDTILMCESDTDSIIHTLCENLK
jgi:hypothetical protein